MSAPFGYICTQSPPTVGWLCQALGVWMLIEKAKIPKGTSFVLRSSVLLEALAAAGISVETSLQHMNSKIFFDAFFWPPRSNVQHERFYIRAGSVPASQARPG